MADPYASLADRYDLFFEEVGKGDPAEVEFFERLFRRHGVHRVLDCACGTGHHLLSLRSLGCDLVGSDISEAMLARARANLAARGASLTVLRADYRDLARRFREPFDAVLCLSTSIAHMPDEPEVLRAFESMRAVLRPGGLLVLTQGTTDRQWREKPRFLLAVDRPGVTRIFVFDYLSERAARCNILDVVREAGQAELKVWSTDLHQVLLRADQERLLLAAGFGAVDFYGSFDFERYDERESGRLIAVAHNRTT
jgi:SAM-dependent methyltransferase